MDRSNVSFVPLGDGLVASTRRVAFDGKHPVDAEAKEFLCVGKVLRGRCECGSSSARRRRRRPSASRRTSS